MSWQQVKPFNQSKAGKTKNMCLANVRSGYSISKILPTAWIAWQQTEQHKGTPPAGVDVPVFFSYTATIDGVRKNWGHIGVRLKNGKFWSDGVTYNSIGAYTANHAPKYVGWGESVNNERVIKEANVSKITKTTIEQLAQGMGGRAAPADVVKHWVGKSTSELPKAVRDIYNSPWAKNYREKKSDGTFKRAYDSLINRLRSIK